MDLLKRPWSAVGGGIWTHIFGSMVWTAATNVLILQGKHCLFLSVIIYRINYPEYLFVTSNHFLQLLWKTETTNVSMMAFKPNHCVPLSPLDKLEVLWPLCSLTHDLSLIQWLHRSVCDWQLQLQQDPKMWFYKYQITVYQSFTDRLFDSSARSGYKIWFGFWVYPCPCSGSGYKRGGGCCFDLFFNLTSKLVIKWTNLET